MFTEKSFKTADGLTLSYDEGADSGPPMILLHGLTGTRQTWHENMVPAYSRTWHQYLFDQRGHGKSERAADADHYRLVDYAGDITAFLHKHLDESAVVVGHSLGAINSIGIGAMASDQVRGLVLLDPPLFARNQSIEARPGPQGWFGWVYDTTRHNPSHEEVLAACRESFPEIDEASLKNMAADIQCIGPGTVKAVLEDRLLEDFDLAQAFQQSNVPPCYSMANGHATRWCIQTMWISCAKICHMSRPSRSRMAPTCSPGNDGTRSSLISKIF